MLNVIVNLIHVAYKSQTTESRILSFSSPFLRRRGLLLTLSTRRSSRSHSATRRRRSRRTNICCRLRRLLSISLRRVLCLATYIFCRPGRFPAGILRTSAHLTNGVLCFLANLFSLAFTFLFATHSKTRRDCPAARFGRAAQAPCEATYGIGDPGAESTDLANTSSGSFFACDSVVKARDYLLCCQQCRLSL